MIISLSSPPYYCGMSNTTVSGVTVANDKPFSPKQEYVMGLSAMANALLENPRLPIPKLSQDHTFVGFIFDQIAPGQLRGQLRELTRAIPGAIQEEYVWSDKPETELTGEEKRVRLIWMFRNIRYELDMSQLQVFGTGKPEAISPDVIYLGKNVNTVHSPTT